MDAISSRVHPPWLERQLLLLYFQEESAWAENWLGTLHHEKSLDYERTNQVFRDIIEMVNSDG